MELSPNLHKTTMIISLLFFAQPIWAKPLGGGAGSVSSSSGRSSSGGGEDFSTGIAVGALAGVAASGGNGSGGGESARSDDNSWKIFVL